MASLRALVYQFARRHGRQKAGECLSPVLVGAGLCWCGVVVLGQQDDHGSNWIATTLKSVADGSCHSLSFSSSTAASSVATTTTLCEGLLEVETEFPESFNESDRFFQVLEYHRTLLPTYTKQWATPPPASGKKAWPRKIPTESDIPGLEMDYRFCKRSPNYRDKDQACQDLQFRIGTYYVTSGCADTQMKGYRLIKELAELGHADGMCYYGIILNEGLVKGVEAKPELAVVWWRRCLDYHKHIWSTYELAVAFYTGEGVIEDTVKAVYYFRKAAHLGHAGAAYMLGELLLDGVGVRRDRASALEWLVTAAELGHYRARQRVLAILQEDWDDLEEGKSSIEQEEESLKWQANVDEARAKAVLIERSYTIGGGSRNPEVLQKRQTKIKESREDQ